MSNPQEKGRVPNSQQNIASSPDITPSPFDLDSRTQKDSNQNHYSRASHSVPPTSPSRVPSRPNVPTRASTIDSPKADRNLSTQDSIPQARSEDLNHGSSHGSYSASVSRSSPKSSPVFANNRPSTPTGSKQQHRSRPENSEKSGRRLSDASGSSTGSSYSPGPPASVASTSLASASVYIKLISFFYHSRLTLPVYPSYRTCSSCGQPMQGAFVRALGTVFHLNCFKCMVGISLPSAFCQPPRLKYGTVGLWRCCCIQIFPY